MNGYVDNKIGENSLGQSFNVNGEHCKSMIANFFLSEMAVLDSNDIHATCDILYERFKGGPVSH